jgi:hypothetical protein
MQKQLVNLTTHPIVILDDRGARVKSVVQPMGDPARVLFDYRPLDVLHGFPLQVRSVAGHNLPPSVPGRFLVVPSAVASCFPWRGDLFVPDRLSRGPDGSVRGCRVLSRGIPIGEGGS